MESKENMGNAIHTYKIPFAQTMIESEEELVIKRKFLLQSLLPEDTEFVNTTGYIHQSELCKIHSFVFSHPCFSDDPAWTAIYVETKQFYYENPDKTKGNNILREEVVTKYEVRCPEIFNE